VFKYVYEKDVFMKTYERFFANRLVRRSSASDDAEEAMIAKLKVCYEDLK